MESLQGHTATGEKIVVKLGGNNLQSTCTSTHTTANEDRRDMVLQVLYLLDKFGVGDTFYHEMSMVQPSLPRSYKVKQARLECNSSVELHTISGYDGVYRSLEITLKKQLSILVYIHTCMSLVVTSYYYYDYLDGGPPTPVQAWRHHQD